MNVRGGGAIDLYIDIFLYLNIHKYIVHYSYKYLRNCKKFCFWEDKVRRGGARLYKSQFKFF